MNFDELRQMSVGSLIALADVADVVAPVLERALEVGLVQDEERTAITAVVFLLSEPAVRLASGCVPPSLRTDVLVVPEGWIPTGEVATKCHVTAQSVRDAIESPTLALRGTKVRGRWFVDPVTVDAYRKQVDEHRH